MAYKHHDRLNGLLQFTMKVLFATQEQLTGPSPALSKKCSLQERLILLTSCGTHLSETAPLCKLALSAREDKGDRTQTTASKSHFSQPSRIYTVTAVSCRPPPGVGVAATGEEFFSHRRRQKAAGSTGPRRHIARESPPFTASSFAPKMQTQDEDEPWFRPKQDARKLVNQSRRVACSTPPPPTLFLPPTAL
jgi:hypothetical protein